MIVAGARSVGRGNGATESTVCNNSADDRRRHSGDDEVDPP